MTKYKNVYHGSLTDNLKFEKGVMYFTNNKDSAIDGYMLNRDGIGVQKGEKPTLYIADITLKNPLKIDMIDYKDETLFNELFCYPNEKNVNELLSQGHDGMICHFDNEDYFCVFSPNQVKFIKKITTRYDDINDEWILNENTINYYDSVKDVYGEEKHKILTLEVDNQTVGYIEYSVYDDIPNIQYIKVKDEYRRKGYGKKLVEKLQSLYPDSEINFGMMTDDGSKLYKALDKDIIINKEYDKKIKHLEKINNWLKKYGSIVNKDIDDWSEEDISYIRKYADIWQKYHNKQQDIEDWLNNNKKQIVKIKHNLNLNESWTDSYDLYDIYENHQPYNVLMEFENGEQNIWFPLIKPTEYKQALLEFMKMGELVRFPKDKVFKWLEIIMKNTCIIDAMTALAGHTRWFPYDDCRNVYNELEDEEDDFVFFSTTLDRKGFYDWCKLPDGSDAWSDYGLQPLWDILDEYQENMTAEQVLVLVNRCLDVTHQRGDLPSAFIEGGSSSLTKISNENKLIKGYKIIKTFKNNGEDAMESLCEEFNLPNSKGLFNKVLHQLTKYSLDDLTIFNVWDVINVIDDNPSLYRQMSKIIGVDEITDDYESEIMEIIDNKKNDNKSFAYKIFYKMVYNKFNEIYDNLLYELDDNNDLIYRKVSASSIDKILEYSSLNGIGVCWAKDLDNAELYNANEGNNYILIAKVNNSNINWVATIICRMIIEEEDEIRLNANTSVNLIKIIDENNKEYNINKIFSSGNSKDYYQFNESNQYESSLFDVLLESNILTEDIEAVKKYFPKVPEEKIQTLVKLDPTYQGGDNLGKFGKWILGLYNKGNLKEEDFYKVPQYLTTFKDNLKKIQNKDIMTYKTLPDLAQVIQPFEGQKDVSKKQQIKQLKSNEAEKVLETSKYYVIHTKTYKANCYYGANTKWCTASKDDDTWFDNYNDKGNLYVVINKKSGKKFQFHFETLSFMDELDREINPSEIISNDNELFNWFCNQVNDKLDVIIENYNEEHYNQIEYGGYTGYSVDVSFDTFLCNCVEFEDDTEDMKKIIIDYVETYSIDTFSSNLIRKLFKSDEEFANKCNNLVKKYSPNDYYMKHDAGKESGLFIDKEYKSNLYRIISNQVWDKVIEPLWEKINNEVIRFEFDDNRVMIPVEESELIESLCSNGDFEVVFSKIDRCEPIEFSSLNITSFDFITKIVYSSIKEWFTGDDEQLELGLDLNENILNHKNPFI